MEMHQNCLVFCKELLWLRFCEMNHNPLSHLRCEKKKFQLCCQCQHNQYRVILSGAKRYGRIKRTKIIKSSQTFLLVLVSCTIFMFPNAPCCSSYHGMNTWFHVSGYKPRSQLLLKSQETVISNWQADHEKPALADIWDATSSQE